MGTSVLSGLPAPLAASNVAMAAAGAAQAATAAGQDLVLPPILPGGLTNLAGPLLNANGGGLTAAPSGAAVRQRIAFQVALTTAQGLQSQLNALNQRYLASGHMQLALAMQRNGAAQAAQNTFDDAKAACQAQLAQSAASGSGPADATNPSPASGQ